MFEVGNIVARLGGLFVDDGFKKFGRAVDESTVRAAKPIEVTLGAKVEEKGFVQAQMQGQAYAKQSFEAKVDADTLPLQRKILAVQGALTILTAEIDRDRNLNIDTAAAEFKVTILKSRLKELNEELGRGELKRGLADLGLAAEDLGTKLDGGGSGGGGATGSLASFAEGIPNLAKVAAAAAPAIVGLSGSVIALGGSLGAAALGAGAVGTGVFGALATGLVSVVAVAKPVIDNFKAIQKATQAHTKAVDQYGKSSTQAASAQAKLNAVIKESGGAPMARAVAGVHALGKEWSQLTKPGQGDLGRLLGGVVGGLHSILPRLATDVNKNVKSIVDSVLHAGKTLRQGGLLGVFDALSHTFQKGVGPAGDIVAKMMLALGNVARAASPYVLQLVHSLDGAASAFFNSTKNSRGLRDTIGGLVDHLKSWLHFIGAVGGALITLFSAGAGQGKGMLDGLTAIVDKWNEWMKSVAGQKSLRNFFHDAIAVTKSLFAVLTPLAAAIFVVARNAMPLFTDAMHILTPIAKIIFVVLKDLSELLRSPFVRAIIGVIAAFKLLRLAWLGLTLLMEVNPFVLIITGLTLLGVGLYEAWKHSKTFRDVVTAVFSAVVDAGKWFVDKFLGWITTFLDGVQKMAEVASHIPGIGGKFKDMARNVAEARGQIDKFREGLRDDNKPVKDHIDILNGQIDVLKHTKTSMMDAGASGDRLRGINEKLRLKQQELNKALGDTPASGRHAAQALDAVAGSAGNMDTVSGKALRNLKNNLNSALKALGAHPTNFTLKQEAYSAAHSAYQAQSGFATGGIPNTAGSAHDDHVLVGPDGQPKAMLSGTEGIINTPQMGVVDFALAFAHGAGALPYSGLNDLWASGMRHYALGGTLGRANKLDKMHLPYVWGGHHGDPGRIKDPHPGLDCSSAAAYVLDIPPRVSGAFESFGKPGPGPVTVFANPVHVFLSILGRGFGTSAENPRGGPGWLSYNSRPGFTVRHVDGDLGNLNLPREVVNGPNGALKTTAQSQADTGWRASNRKLRRTLSSLDVAGGQPLNEFTGPWVNTLQEYSRQHHWNANDWKWIVQHESGGNPNAINASSGARGLGQMLGSNINRYSGDGTANQQIVGMGRYINDRYGNPTSAKNFWQKHHWYKGGGRLRRFAGGGSLRGLATGGTPRGRHTPPRGNVSSAVLNSLTRFSGLPGIPDLQAVDDAIQTMQGQYDLQSRFSTLVDGQITPKDLQPLIDIRQGIFGVLTKEQGDIGVTQKLLTVSGNDRQRQEAIARQRASEVAQQIAALKRRMQNETRRLTVLRHGRASQVMKLADKLAGKVTGLTAARTRNTDAQRGTLDSYRSRITGLRNRISTARTTWAEKIRNASTPQQRRNLQTRRDREIGGLQGQLQGLQGSRDGALGRLRGQGQAISRKEAAARREVATARRHYSRRGFDDAWAFQLRRWKEDDELKRLEAAGKALVGSASGVGTGGALGTILKQEAQISAAQAALQSREDALPTTIGSAVLDLLDLHQQQGTVPPGDVAAIATQLGLVAPTGPAADTTAGGGTTAGGTAGTPSAADVAAAARTQLASFESQQSDLFSQFGSNFATSPTMRSVLSSSGGGLRHFGAAGAAAAGTFAEPATPTTQKIFQQNNHYQVGPDDPHVHAQVSRVEFESTLG